MSLFLLQRNIPTDFFYKIQIGVGGQRQSQGVTHDYEWSPVQPGPRGRGPGVCDEAFSRLLIGQLAPILVSDWQLCLLWSHYWRLLADRRLMSEDLGGHWGKVRLILESTREAVVCAGCRMLPKWPQLILTSKHPGNKQLTSSLSHTIITMKSSTTFSHSVKSDHCIRKHDASSKIWQ